MTIQQAVSVFYAKDSALVAIAYVLHVEYPSNHLIGLDDSYLGGLLHEAQNIIDLN
jgi:hypothetical protein